MKNIRLLLLSITLLLGGIIGILVFMQKSDSIEQMPKSQIGKPTVQTTSIPPSEGDQGELNIQAKKWIEDENPVFVENGGQLRDTRGDSRSDIKYVLRGDNLSLFFTKKGVSYVFTHKIAQSFSSKQKSEAKMRSVSENEVKSTQIRSYRVDMELIGANPNVMMRGENEAGGQRTYYTEGTSVEPIRVKSFSKLVYQDIYPSIDLIYYANGKEVKYDFVVRPGGDPADIRFKYSGAEDVEIADDGGVEVRTPLGNIKEERPYTYQQEKSTGKKSKIESRFDKENEEIYFKVEKYDKNTELVIDPNLVWATYFGGGTPGDINEPATDIISSIISDSEGNIVVVGGSGSSDFPTTTGAFSISYAGGVGDAVIVKFDPEGHLIWSTFYGGSDVDFAIDIAADSDNNYAVVGVTASTDFPVTTGAFQTSFGGLSDAFILKLDKDGNREWATYYGGSQWEQHWYNPGGLYVHNHLPADVAVDGSDNLVVVGSTESSNLPVTITSFQSTSGGGEDGYIVKFDPTGARMWATYIGGSSVDYATSITIDGVNSIYLSGVTSSTNFPVTSSSYQNTISGSTDVFLMKFSNIGQRSWGTYLGGSQGEGGHAVLELASNGNLVVAGTTSSTDFPTTNDVLYPSKPVASGDPGFVASLNSNGQQLIWATYFVNIREKETPYADPYSREIRDICLDKSDNVAILTAGVNGGLFLTSFDVLRGDGTAVLYSDHAWCYDAYYDQYYACGKPYAITHDKWGDIIVGGYVGGDYSSSEFVASSGAEDISHNGAEDFFLMKLSYLTTYYGGSGNDYADNVSVDDEDNIVVAGYTISTDFPTANGVLMTNNGNTDAFVFKLNKIGQKLWSTYYGGSGNDYAYDVAVDGNNDVFIAGLTYSVGLSGTSSGFQNTNKGSGDGFLIKILEDGSAISWATYYGGSNADSILSLAIDGSNNVAVIGTTASSKPSLGTMGVPVQGNNAGGKDAFIARFSGTGGLQLATYYGGSGDDFGWGIATDFKDNLVVTGVTGSSNLGVTANALQSALAGGVDVFLGKIASDGKLQWATYYGGTGNDLATAVATDEHSDIGLTGYTSSTDFPISTYGHQSTNSGQLDAFLLKFSALGKRFWATLHGGSGNDYANDVVIDKYGNLIASGSTTSTNLPVKNAEQGALNGTEDAFIWGTDEWGKLELSTYWGGGSIDVSRGVAVDGLNELVIVGYSNSTDIDVSPIVEQAQNNGGYDAVIHKLNGVGGNMKTMTTFGTYYGGTGFDGVNDVAVDDHGNILVTGTTLSTDFPTTTGAFQATLNTTAGALADVFVVKFDPAGNRLWSTYYGGSGGDEGWGVATGEQGRVFVTGSTTSLDFPVTAGAFQGASASGYEAFVFSLDMEGQRTWATYYGGHGVDAAWGIAVDHQNKVSIVGNTTSIDLYTSPGAFQGGIIVNTPVQKYDAFLARFNHDGSINYSTYYGGEFDDIAWDVAVDANGGIYFTGETDSPGFPVTTGGYAGGGDAFVVKFSATNARQWGRFYGGTGAERGEGICTDGAANGVFMTGFTTSTSLPFIVGSSFQSTLAGASDAYLLKLSSTGVPAWATYMGGSSSDNGKGVAIMSNGQVVVSGTTSSTNFPISTSTAFQTTLAGSVEGFIMTLNSTGTTRVWGTYYGGSSAESETRVSLDGSDYINFSGWTSSADFPVTADGYETSAQGSSDGFVVRLDDQGGRKFPRMVIREERENVVHSQLSDHSLNFLPSPAREYVRLLIEDVVAGSVRVQLHDMSGRLVAQQEFNHQGGTLERTVMIAELPSGIYFVGIDVGDHHFQQKIIKVD